MKRHVALQRLNSCSLNLCHLQIAPDKSKISCSNTTLLRFYVLQCAETGHASIQPHDPTGTSHGAPRIRQQPSVSPCDAWCDGPVSQETCPSADSAGAATEPQPAVSSLPPLSCCSPAIYFLFRSFSLSFFEYILTFSCLSLCADLCSFKFYLFGLPK